MKYTKKDIALPGWVVHTNVEDIPGFSLLGFPEMAKDAMNTNVLRYEKKVAVFPEPIMQYWLQPEYEHHYPKQVKEYLFTLMDAGNDVYDYIGRKEVINIELFKKYLELSAPFVYKVNTDDYEYVLLDCRYGNEFVRYKIFHNGEKFALDISNETALKHGQKDSLRVEVEGTKEVFWIPVYDRMNLKIQNENYDLPQPFVVRKYYKDEQLIPVYKRALEIVQIAEWHNKKLTWEVFSGW